MPPTPFFFFLPLPVDLCTCPEQQDPLRIPLSLPEVQRCYTSGATKPKFPVEIVPVWFLASALPCI